LANPRVYAYSIPPQRDEPSPVQPRCAQVTDRDVLRSIAEAKEEAKFDGRTLVTFNLDPATRTCSMREALMRFGFGQTRSIRAAADEMAMRLSTAMDQRTKHSLFVVAAEDGRTANHRAITLWTFPRDQAYHFKPGTSELEVELLVEVFTKSSKHKKAALFEGRETRVDFLNGRVVDHQANSRINKVANYWIDDFLGASLSIEAASASKLMGRGLRAAHAAARNAAEQEEVMAAIMTLKHSQQRMWTFRSFAENHLTGFNRAKFLEAMPDEGAQNSGFEFVKDAFEEAVQYRVFQLPNQVFVTSPLSEVNRSVKIIESRGDGQRRVRCEGEIVDEKIRSAPPIRAPSAVRRAQTDS